MFCVQTCRLQAHIIYSLGAVLYVMSSIEFITGAQVLSSSEKLVAHQNLETYSQLTKCEEMNPLYIMFMVFFVTLFNLRLVDFTPSIFIIIDDLRDFGEVMLSLELLCEQ